MLKLRSFDVFSKMFEEEKTGTEAGNELGGLELFLNNLFSVYFRIASYIDSYDDVVNDIKKIQGEELSKKASALARIITDDLSPKVENTNLKNEFSKDEFKNAVNVIGASFEELAKKLDEKEANSVEKKLSDLCYDKIQELIKTYKDQKTDNVNESLSDVRYRNADHLFEKKNTFKDKRGELLRTVNTQMADLKTQIDNAMSSRHSGKLNEIYKKLEIIQKELSDKNENYWVGMKRKNRLERLSEIPGELQEIIQLVFNETTKELAMVGLEKSTLAKVQDAMNKINSYFDSASKILTDEMGKDEYGKSAEQEKGKSKDILSGLKDKKNLTKKGPNLQKIREVQEMLNQVLPEKDRLAKADGLYGEKTEKAVERVSSMLRLLNPEIEITGKKMSKLFIETLTKLIKDKGIEEIRSKFFKNKVI